MEKIVFFCLAVQLLAACVHSVRPVLRVPRDAPTTGRCTVALKPSASEKDLQKLMTTVMKVADDAKVYGYVERVAKAFTVKLSPYALEIVRVAFLWPSLHGCKYTTYGTIGRRIKRLFQLILCCRC